MDLCAAGSAQVAALEWCCLQCLCLGGWQTLFSVLFTLKPKDGSSSALGGMLLSAEQSIPRGLPKGEEADFGAVVLCAGP